MIDRKLIKEITLATATVKCKSRKKHVKMAHIAFSDSDMDMLKFNLHINFRSNGLEKEYEVILLNLSLHSGDISAPPDSNSNVYSLQYLTLQQEKDLLSDSKRKLDELDDEVEIYLWKNHLFANTLLNYFYFAPLFKRFRHVWVVDINTPEQLKKRDYEPFESLQGKKIVLPEDLNAAAEEFGQYKSGKYRVLVSGTIQSFPEDYFDEMVLSCVKSTWQCSRVIISQFIEKQKEKGFVLDYAQEKMILHRLAQKGFIESNYEYGFAYGAMMIEDISFRIARSKKNYTSDEAINILALAIECGGTARLFDLLAEDAIFICSNNNEVKGRQAICDYIETIAVAQSEKKINCSCLVTEGDEGKQIELTCNDYKDKCIIRIYFNSGKIQKILVGC